MNQNFRYTDLEFEVISNTVHANPDIVTLIRRYFLQDTLSDGEIRTMTGLVDTDFYPVLKKVLLPTLDAKSALGQNVDMWVNINTREKSVDDAYLEMAARQIVIRYLEEMFDNLDSISTKRTYLKDLTYNSKKSREQAFIELSARNTLLQHIDTQLYALLTIAGTKKETAEEIKERIKKNDSR